MAAAAGAREAVMIAVIDKNLLEDPELEVFLRDSADHQAVLVEFVGIEGYAGNPIKNMSKSLSIVARYPRQVLVMKGARDIQRMGPIDPNLRLDLIEWKQTRGFPRFCEDLKLAEQGDDARRTAILNYGKAATAQLDGMLAATHSMIELLEQIRKKLPPEVMKAFRENKPIPGVPGSKVFRDIVGFADYLFKQDPDKPKMPEDLQVARHCFLFRYAAAFWSLALHWARAGGCQGVRREKLRNDFVDLMYVVAASYFDVLLSRDEKMESIYCETMVLVEDLWQEKTGT